MRGHHITTAAQVLRTVTRVLTATYILVAQGIIHRVLPSTGVAHILPTSTVHIHLRHRGRVLIRCLREEDLKADQDSLAAVHHIPVALPQDPAALAADRQEADSQEAAHQAAVVADQAVEEEAAPEGNPYNQNRVNINHSGVNDRENYIKS